MKSKRAREAAEVDDVPIVGAEVPAKKRKRSGDDEDNVAEKKVKKDKKKKDKKKDQKELRKDRKEKRKDLLNLPEEDGDEDLEAEVEKAVVSEETKTKKKDKQEKTVEEVNGKDKNEKKKEKKGKKKSKAETNGTTNGETTPSTSEDPKQEASAAAATTEDGIDLDADTANKQDRHIVFVGNLPYTATAASISAHFATLSPIAVRCLKNKGDDKPCRGIAFVEFGKVWHMRTCLDKFHHSLFDDGVSPARKINVELTAGGGGKTQNRQDKIREKNQKLDENRTKRIEREKQVKNESGAENGTTQKSIGEDSIHPSRRARVPGNGH